MKKDIASRLAHKRPYAHIANKPEEQIDLLIVVDQMLTGFDSKWINTLYMDKMLKYENIIQHFRVLTAFLGRKNRLALSSITAGHIQWKSVWQQRLSCILAISVRVVCKQA